VHKEVNLHAKWLSLNDKAKKGDIMPNDEVPKTLRFPVKSFRKIPNPYSDSLGTPQSTPEMYELICDVKDIPDDIPMETNPREQNLKTNVAKKIETSLLNSSEHNFYLLNRGLLLSAYSVSFDNINSVVTVNLTDLSLHGDVDGGHSYKIILESRDELDKGQQYVKVEILTGVEDFYQDLAAARNTSIQVKDKSIAELEGLFDLIKDAFRDEPYAGDVNYKENDDKRIDITDLLSVLYLFNIDRYPVNQWSYPISAYSAKKVCTDTFILDAKKYVGDKTQNPYFKMRPIIVDIFKLYDRIEVGMGNFYKGEATGIKRYGSVSGVVTCKPGSAPFKSKFYQQEMSYYSPNGFLYPIIGAFRALVYEKDGEYAWKLDPFDLLNKLGSELVGSTIDTSRNLGNNPNATGKFANLWKTLFMMVQMETMQAM
jgi:hypothetical protein